MKRRKKGIQLLRKAAYGLLAMLLLLISCNGGENIWIGDWPPMEHEPYYFVPYIEDVKIPMEIRQDIPFDVEVFFSAQQNPQALKGINLESRNYFKTGLLLSFLISEKDIAAGLAPVEKGIIKFEGLPSGDWTITFRTVEGRGNGGGRIFFSKVPGWETGITLIDINYPITVLPAEES